MSPKNKKETPEEAKKKQKMKMLIRLLITIVAFFFLFKYGNVNLGEAINHLMQIDLSFFTLACIVYFISITVAGVRFFIASNVLGFHKSQLQCIQLNFVGVFFNNFLPTTFGGDALRGYYLKRGTQLPLTKAAACILCERYAGMVVLFWLSSLIFVLYQWGVIDKSTWSVRNEFAWFSYAGTWASVFLVPFLPKINKLFFGKGNWLYQKTIEPVIVYWHNSSLIVKIFILSFFLQGSVILCHVLIALSLGLTIPLSYFLVFYPLTTIAGFLIPSLNGLGVREGAYIYFFSIVGINSDQGLAFGLCWLIILFITSIAGGLVYMFGDFRKNMSLEKIQSLDNL